MLSQILCLAFDAVGTLIYPDPPVAEVYAQIGRKFGSQLSEAEVGRRFLEAFHRAMGPHYSTNEAEERRKWWYIVYCVFYGIDDLDGCFEELFAHFGRAESWKCYAEVEETLQELSARGYDLMLASNFDRRLHAICQGHPELSGFSTKIISSEVGMPKPDPGFYRAMMDRSGFESHELFMVGDDWVNDIRGPLEMGIQAIYLDRSQAEPVAEKDDVTVISSLAELLGLLP